jgi:murein DD-endopeptidase MepM/ murein hydrolase activator NlpD
VTVRRRAAFAAAVALLVGMGATGGRAAEHESTLTATGDRLDLLETRIAALERRLGLTPVSGERAEHLARYEALRQREAEVARRAAEWLRFVPSDAPVEGGVITSSFSAGRYHPIRRRVQPHVGIDIAAPHGAPVRVTADGTVHAVAESPTYGLTVDVRHGDSGFVTRYAHLSHVAVRPGQAVERGELVGRVGSTGLSTGPHLHYEVYYQGWRRDPIAFLPSLPVDPGARR